MKALVTHRSRAIRTPKEVLKSLPRKLEKFSKKSEWLAFCGGDNWTASRGLFPLQGELSQISLARSRGHHRKALVLMFPWSYPHRRKSNCSIPTSLVAKICIACRRIQVNSARKLKTMGFRRPRRNDPITITYAFGQDIFSSKKTLTSRSLLLADAYNCGLPLPWDRGTVSD